MAISKIFSRYKARVFSSASNSSERALSHTYLMEGGSNGLSSRLTSEKAVTLGTLRSLRPRSERKPYSSAILDGFIRRKNAPARLPSVTDQVHLKV